MFMLLLLCCFALLPAVEIYLLIQVGRELGVLNTLGLLLLMGILGVALARSQGRVLLIQAQAALSRGDLPASQVLHGLLVVVGGVLMFVPGFFTDILGFFFVLPGSRHLMVAFLRRYLARQLELGRIHLFGGTGAGSGFGGFRRAPRGPFDGPGSGAAGAERDVSPKVIDVSASRVEDEPKSRVPADDEPR